MIQKRDWTVKTTNKFSSLKAGVAPVVLGFALIASPAFAQTAEEDTASEEIVVTGTLIANPNLEKSTPVNVTTADAIELKQSNVAEEVLREIPGVVPSIGSAVNNGNGGASYVDLRGLGSNRNVVLLDGNRIAPSGLVGRVDLNNIPLALVERVDAQTGAAVTTYGADAITGVVNFITKKNFSGLEVSAGTSMTEKGDGNTFRVDTTIGANFDDGRGNAVFSIGYQEADPVYQGDRDFSINNIDSYTGAAGGSGTSVPSRISGTRPIDPLTGLPSVNPATLNGGVRQINAAGQAVGTFQTFNFNPYNIFQTPFKRFNMFGQANYQISDSVEIYTRGLFSKNNVKTIIAPSGSFGGAVDVNLNNPFLPAALRNQLCAFNVATVASGLYTPRFDQATCDAAALATNSADPRYRTVNVTLARRAVEVGPRISDFQTTIFDYRVGLRGGITDSINWDVSGSYGESENIQTLKGYTLQSRWRQASLVNGTAANPVCADSSNGCVPANWFGPQGSITPAAASFLSGDSTTTVRTTLAQARAVVSGDVGYSLSGDTPIGFAAGGEYRKYTATQSSDLLAQTAGELGGAGGAAPNINGGYHVYEAFGEIIAPIVEGKPFFESLTLEAGARYSSYSVAAAGSPGYNTTTWKAGGSWEPTQSLKIRGNFSRAVRAPNISELFTPVTTGLTNLGVDPCAGAAPTTNANLRAVCIAQGAPAGTIGAILNPTAAQANITSGGNLAVGPEKADTWTVGAVWRPDFIRNFSISVDYYNIKVKGEIGTPLPGDLISACFDGLSAASATDPNCTVIRRNPVTGGLDGDPATTPGLSGVLSNLGVLKTNGVDMIANWKGDLGFADLSVGFVGNWTRSQKFKATPTSLDRECVGYFSVNCSFTGSMQPEFQTSTRFTLGFEKVDVSLLWRWMSKMDFEPQQIIDDGGDANSILPQYRHISPKSYFDLATRFNVTDNLTLTATVTNLLDSKPFVVGSTAGSTSFNSGNVYPSTYDSLGRRYAISAKVKF